MIRFGRIESRSGRRAVRLRDTTAFRLTLLYGIGLAVAIVALLVLTYGLVARELTQRSDRILRAEAASLLAVPPAALPARIRFEAARGVRGVSYSALLARDGTRVAGNLAVGDPPSPGRPVDALLPSGRPIRLLAMRTAAGETVMVGRDTGQIRDLRRTLLRILLGSGLLIALLGLAGVVGLSLGPLRRVAAFRRAAELIGAGDFAVRMPLSGRHDELDAFAAAVNLMVDEMARVLAQVKGVSDAIAHDLRTPLTHVRAALDRARTVAGGQGAAPIDEAIADLDLALERFAALLRLSALEASGRRAGFGRVDLRALLLDAAELYQPLAEARDQRLVERAELSATVTADGKLLFEALSNLLDNAIKFTPPGGRIELALTGTPAEPWLEVTDTGPGIPPAERRAVLRRFHRGAGTEGIPGSGLGLSMVAAIAHMHGFELAFGAGEAGLRVGIGCFPSRAHPPQGEIHFTRAA